MQARAAMLALPHMAPLERWRESLLGHGPVPHADPADGGTAPRLLLLLETPGPGVVPLRFVSRDNATGTAANLRRFLGEAGIARGDTLIWNAVSWIVHAAGARNRPLRRAEIAAGLVALPPLLDLLPDLAVVVLAGRVAAEAAPVIARVRPALPLLRMPHPSPTYVCTSPLVAARIAEALTAAAALLAPSPHNPDLP